MSGYVYIVKNGNNNYKIGYTNSDIDKRIDSLKTSSDSRIELVFYFVSDDPAALEKKLHNEFSKRRIKGEWFHLYEHDIIKISKMDGVEKKENDNKVIMFNSGIKSMLDLSEISISAHLLLQYFIFIMDDRNCVWMPKRLMAENRKCSMSTISRSIKMLREFSFIFSDNRLRCYVVNSRIAWNNSVRNIESSLFSEQINMSKTIAHSFVDTDHNMNYNASQG